MVRGRTGVAISRSCGRTRYQPTPAARRLSIVSVSLGRASFIVQHVLYLGVNSVWRLLQNPVPRRRCCLRDVKQSWSVGGEVCQPGTAGFA